MSKTDISRPARFRVMSIVYDPSKATLWAAWEDGTGAKGWRPAACNAYVELDLSSWFGKK